MPPTAQPQTALDEKVIDDSELEKALDDRERAKGAKAEATSVFKTKDDVVKGKLDDLGLEVGQVARIGRFRIEKRQTESSHVEFERGGGEKLSIKLAQDD